jgi:biopolymer transport protein ExbB/TolQ
MYLSVLEIIQFCKAGAQTSIYLISTNLLYPVIIILLGLIFWSLIEFGCFLFEWHVRHRDLETMEKGALKGKKLLENNDFAEAAYTINKSCSNEFVHNFATSLSGYYGEFHNRKFMQIRTEKLMQDCDTTITKKLERTRFVARAAPMFGLMGTLIPMGPALLGLAEGDTQALSDNLIMAFGTTVVGLVAGVFGYMISTVRSRWYEQDMSDIEYISEILFGDSSEVTLDTTSGIAPEIAPRIASENTSGITPEIAPRIASGNTSGIAPEIVSGITLENTTEDTVKIPKKDDFGVIKVISGFVYFDMIFTPTSVIIARTAGNILNHPIVFAGLCGILNALVILASMAGYTVLPLHLYLIFINLLMVLIFLALRRMTTERAIKKSQELIRLPQNVILMDDPHNIEVNYSDIEEVNISQSMMKILSKNGWFEVGRLESHNYMNAIPDVLRSVIVGDKT